MTERQLEADLRDLSQVAKPPATLAADVMRRIEASPGCGGRTPRVHVTLYRVAAAIALAGGGVAFLVTITHRHAPAPRPPVAISTTTSTRAIERGTDPAPSLADYRRALAQSPEALDALLQPRPETPGSNSRTNAELRAGDVSWINLDSYR
jgi:hypothetical protein